MQALGRASASSSATISASIGFAAAAPPRRSVPTSPPPLSSYLASKRLISQGQLAATWAVEVGTAFPRLPLRESGAALPNRGVCSERDCNASGIGAPPIPREAMQNTE